MRRTWFDARDICIGLTLLASMSGCGGEGADTDMEPPNLLGAPLCPPNTLLACSCEGGARGTQLCDAAGRLAACVCDSPGPAEGMTGADGGASTGDSTSGSTGSTAGSMGFPWPGSNGGGAEAGTTAGSAATTGDTAGTTGASTGMPMPDPGMMEDAGMDPGPVEGDDSIPDNPYCADTVGWDPMWAQWEQEVLMLTNEVRASGANCDSMGMFGPTTPVTMQPALRCSARMHSKDMVEQDYFAHDGLDGRSPFDRMGEAGYAGGLMGENIAWGQRSPQEVVDGWVDSDGHCANLMNPGFSELGVGYYLGEGTNAWNAKHMWTQNFGAPRGAGGGNWWQ